ncbi:hypothetical protein [Actinoplanes flavus]|uniref:Uncharacterized protein n=1 Tax=Actinoplanes flavus TaxID=2820290 RepID=A0ABS3UJY1_9ACTN|nr:hypothetical protein [Actinoplanes flavus]MBO3738761.1 hypothetical protein [Actinoplanes flavus]
MQPATRRTVRPPLPAPGFAALTGATAETVQPATRRTVRPPLPAPGFAALTGADPDRLDKLVETGLPETPAMITTGRPA